MTAQGQENNHQGHGFGTLPVFLASISTILGAILFLRFGYAVANVGVLGTLAIIAIGHVVTIPTALAIAEIATNRRVEGGGEYFIISRSFGSTIGAAIGIALYLSQAISVAFYMIAFAEAFRPIQPWFVDTFSFFDARIISLPAVIVLVLVMLKYGANLGVKVLWIVASILGISLVMFFLGSPVPGAENETLDLFATIDRTDPFILVFAIVFPAFTGATAGVGLSGDLANPRKSIPLGIISAVVVGIIVYALVVVKLSVTATPQQLAEDPLIMSRIALWGNVIPIVLIGLGAATLSSAIGSILVAPRTLQAIAHDGLLPAAFANRFLAKGEGPENEPRNATLVTAVFAFVVVSLGNVDFVARIISMFFMVTYGALCAISFLEYFAARPSYRPSFRSKWFISLIGAIACFMLMFQMDPVFAIVALACMVLFYRWVGSREAGRRDISTILFSVLTQAARYVQIKLQQNRSTVREENWRPSVLMVNKNAFDRVAPIQFMNWLCYRYGFGTYLHFIPGLLDEKKYSEGKKKLNRLLDKPLYRQGGVYIQSIISPSMRSALAQSLQVPGVSGIENNSVIFEFSVHDEDSDIQEIIESCTLSRASRMNNIILRHGDHFFGARKQIHVWLTWHDSRNANLQILLSYILIAHPDWNDAELSVYAAFPRDDAAERSADLEALISAGRIPISQNNIRIFATDDTVDFAKLVQARSATADLVVMGMTHERLQEKGVELLKRYPLLQDVLFVSAKQRISID